MTGDRMKKAYKIIPWVPSSITGKTVTKNKLAHMTGIGENLSGRTDLA